MDGSCCRYIFNLLKKKAKLFSNCSLTVFFFFVNYENSSFSTSSPALGMIRVLVLASLLGV